MYNGIGLQTARGTGTNGYVQSNLSHLLLSRRRVDYNAEGDIAKAEAALNRRPNEDLLNHQRKRQVELKCTEFEVLMEDKGFNQEDIDNKVSDYRRLLLSQLESGELNVDNEICLKDSHARQKFAVQKRAQWKEALKIDKDFKPGSSMQNMNKEEIPEDEVVLANRAMAKEEDEQLEKLVKVVNKMLKKKEKEAKKKLKEKNKRARKASTSSSDSSWSDSDSDSGSDSSSTSSDSDREERMRRKEKAKKMIKRSVKARKIKRELTIEPKDKRRPSEKYKRHDSSDEDAAAPSPKRSRRSSSE